MTTINVERLADLQGVFNEKARHLKNLILNVNKQGLDDPKTFKQRTDEIRNEICFKQITLSRPATVDRGMAPNVLNNPMAGRGGFRIDVVYRVRQGAADLLSYKPNGDIINGRSEVIYQPVDGEITIELTMNNHNTEQSIEQAELKMDSTHELIGKLNEAVVEWNKDMTAQIMELLTDLRNK